MPFAAGGTLVASYTNGTDRWELRVPVAEFDPTTFAYTGAGLKTPTESGLAETFSTFGSYWAPYFDSAWALTIEAVFWTSAGMGQRLSTVPTAASIPGTSATPSSTAPPIQRGFTFQLDNGERHVLRLFGIATELMGARRAVSATSGGFDARDQALMAYLAGPATGLVAWDGQVFPPTAFAYQRYKLRPFDLAGPPGPPGPAGSGSAVDGSGALSVDCLTFPHGQGICGDVAATLRFLMGDGEDHGMDDTGYTLPGGHRLERHSGSPSGAPPPTAGVSLFPSTPTLALSPAPSPPSDLSSVTWGIRFGPLFDGGVVYCMLTSRPDGPSVANPFFRTALYRDNGDGTFTRISYFDLGGLPNPGPVILGDSSALPSGQHSWGNQAVSTLFSPGPLGSDVAVDSFHEYILVICSNALWPDMVDPAYTFGSNDYLETPGTTYFAVNSMELTATSFDIVGFAATTPPGQMAADIVYVYPAQPDVVRLVHEGGRTDWQHNSVSFEVRSAGVPVLQTPLAVLTTTPATLVGQDPATNLPAYCPQATAVTQIVPIPPVIPPPMGADAHEALCGAATAMADWLEGVYQNLANWVGGLESTLLAVVLDVVINVVIDALTAGAGVALGFLDQGAIVTLSTFITTHLVGSDWPSLSSSADDTIRNTAYCALQPTVGNIIVTDAIVADWSSRLNAANVGTIFPSGVTVPVLRLVMLCVGPAKFQQLAVAGSASPTSACSGVTCP